MKLKELLSTVTNGFVHIKANDLDLFLFDCSEEHLNKMDTKLLNRKIDRVESAKSEKDDKATGIEVYLI